MASFDLIRKAQTAGLWFIGVFMEGFICVRQVKIDAKGHPKS